MVLVKDKVAYMILNMYVQNRKKNSIKKIDFSGKICLHIHYIKPTFPVTDLYINAIN